jgi:HAD superfamily hydrolase (TIGR01509 family)
MLRAVVFDFDGVIADSEPLHFRALRECLLPEGVTIDEREYYSTYLAYDDRTSIRLALENHLLPYDSARVTVVAERKAKVFDAMLRRVPFFPGVPELIAALAREVPLAIASGANRDEIERILEVGGLRDHFSAIVGADDVARTKPDPQPYERAVALLARDADGLLPGECVAFEDSMAGIASARGAGLKVVGVTTSYSADKLGGAHRVVQSLAGVTRSELEALFA